MLVRFPEGIRDVQSTLEVDFTGRASRIPTPQLGVVFLDTLSGWVAAYRPEPDEEPPDGTEGV